MLAIYLHYEDANQETKILQRSMMRRDVSYYDLILMIEEVGFQEIDFLYYVNKTRLGSPYFVHMYDQGHVMKMLSDPEIVKDVHLYVSKEKAGDDVAPPSKQFDIAPSNHPNESVLLQEGGVYAEGEGAGQLTLKRTQRPLRRSKRLNVIQVTDQCDDDDGDCNNGEQFAPGHESEALDNEQGQDENQDKEVRKRKRTSLPIVRNIPKGQRIIVKCNENSQPIGDEGAILGKFLGTIARNGGFCPLNINDWRDVKKNSGEETILQCVQALAEKNIISRSLVKNSHNAGTKSFACWSEDMRQADPEKKRPHKSQVYLATHKKKDDANAENIDRNERLDRLKNLITERPELAQNLNGRVAWEGDALQEVLGKEKIVQVHGMGLLPTPKQVYGWTPRYLKNINMTTTDGSPYEVEHDVWEEIAKMKEHIKRQDQIIEHMKNKEGHVNNEAEELPILHAQRKRIQCNGPVEARSSMQHHIYEDNNLSRSHEKAGDHDVNQLQIQQNSSSPQDLVIDSVPEVREMGDPTGESFSRQNQQGTRTEHPHLARSRKRRTSTIKAGSKVVLKTSTYPNKRNVAYGTIRSTDPRTTACGIELGAEFALVRIDQPLLDNEELVREVSDCKTIGEAYSSGYLIAWPSAFIREKDN
ncbi:hypothetical protein D1007_35905 [Hordeum vulgare]|nr:hypothetical protein D1007_35905 [Hordeum vulgare]